MSRVRIRFRFLPHGEGLAEPAPQTAHSAGCDLRAAVEDELVVAPGKRVKVPTGIALEIPPGWEGQVRPRSGLAWRHGVTLLNSPGTIDADYRGEVGVILINLGEEDFVVRRGDRIAQVIFAPVGEVTIVRATELSRSDRGSDGFGSTGRN